MKQFTESLRYEFNFDHGARVLDVGAFEANWSLEMWKRYGCTIYALEPIREYYWDCLRRLRGTTAVALPFALGAEARSAVFRKSNDSSGQFGNWAGVDPESVEMITLSQLLHHLRWDWVSVLKLNCEGSEYEILEHCIEHGHLHRFSHIHVQFHKNVPNCDRRREMIRQELAKTHDEDFCEAFVWEGWKRR